MEKLLLQIEQEAKGWCIGSTLTFRHRASCL